MPRKMSELDVGARGGLCEPWSNYDKNLIRSILVEPDSVEAERLKINVKDEILEIVLPYALWEYI